MNFREAKEQAREQCEVFDCEVDRPYVYVKLKTSDGRYACGFAKCSWRDEWIPDRGVEIAKGRAVAKLAREMVRREDPLYAWGVSMGKVVAHVEDCVARMVAGIEEGANERGEV